jgi:oxazoline/thiazoline dehydrogenase
MQKNFEGLQAGSLCAEAPDTSAWLSGIRLQMSPDVLLYHDHDDLWSIQHGGRTISFRLPGSKLHAVFSTLAQKGWALPDLKPMLEESPGPLSVAEQLGRLWRAGLLVQVLHCQGTPAAILHARGEVPLLPEWIDSTASVVLSERGCIRKQGDHLVVDATEYGATLEIHNPDFYRVLVEMCSARTCLELAESSGLEVKHVMEFVSWLLAIGMAGRSEISPRQDSFDGWAFPDRLLHARSRSGRHVGGYGGTFPGRHKVPQPPPRRAAAGESLITLPPVDLRAIRERDLPFTEVLDSRRSVREHSGGPITIAELGEFLYRSARVSHTHRVGEAEFLMRPFPSAGGLYEIDFYPLIHSCQGQRSSLYRYDGEKHALAHVSDPGPSTRSMLAEAVQCCGLAGVPQVLIILAARFSRINWKYESIAYSLILKNVGIVYQTMYLVATAMGLAPCALGGGSALDFCRAARTDYWEESAVGEFLLGRSPEKRAKDHPTTEGRQPCQTQEN